DQPQLPGPHGAQGGAGLPREPADRRGQCADRGYYGPTGPALVVYSGAGDPLVGTQLDVNALIKIVAGVAEFVAFAIANQAAGLPSSEAARNEFLANNWGAQSDLDDLEQTYGIALISDVAEVEIDATATRLQTAFQGDSLGRILRVPDARILATVLM